MERECAVATGHSREEVLRQRHGLERADEPTASQRDPKRELLRRPLVVHRPPARATSSFRWISRSSGVSRSISRYSRSSDVRPVPATWRNRRSARFSPGVRTASLQAFGTLPSPSSACMTASSAAVPRIFGLANISLGSEHLLDRRDRRRHPNRAAHASSSPTRRSSVISPCSTHPTLPPSSSRPTSTPVRRPSRCRPSTSA